MSSALTFYTNPMSRGRIVRWMLEEVGEPYQTEVLEYGTTMKGPAYLAINPMGKVPALRHARADGAAVVTECAAICAYLADAFPAAGLAPPLDRRADYYRWLFFAAGPLEAAVLNRSLGFETSAEQQMTAGYGSYDLVVDVLDGVLSEREYIAGEAFSAADVYVGSQVGWGLEFETLPARPSFARYAARLNERTARQRAAELDDALQPG